MRHNVLHLQWFRIGYSRDAWTCRFGSHAWRFPYYPYLAFQDIEGYLQNGQLLPDAGMTVLDIGGCYGEYSLFASALVGPTGRVIMVEPDPHNIEKAKTLFALNGNPQNITIVEAGMWDSPGFLEFDVGLGPQTTVSAIHDRLSFATPEPPTKTKVRVHSLRSLIDELNLDRLDLIKMDVEGAELQIVAGAADLPERVKPRYAIASYHVVDGTRTADALPTLFERLHYQCATGNERHMTTWAWPAPRE